MKIKLEKIKAELEANNGYCEFKVGGKAFYFEDLNWCIQGGMLIRGKKEQAIMIFSTVESVNTKAIQIIAEGSIAMLKKEQFSLERASIHHVASRKGYCNASEIGSTTPYHGRFGIGYIKVLGRYHGSSNYTAIAYYTLSDADIEIHDSITHNTNVRKLLKSTK